MLPFLKPKDQGVAGLIVKNRKPDEKTEEKQVDKSSLEDSMEKLRTHLDSGDFKAAAECFKRAFQACENQPHSEGPHTYEAQNKEAGDKE